MRRSRARSIAPGTFPVAQPWADCITDMPGFNLRQADPARCRSNVPCGHSRPKWTPRFIPVSKLTADIPFRQLRAITGSLLSADHFVGANHLGVIAEGQRDSRHRRAITWHRSGWGTRFWRLFLD